MKQDRSRESTIASEEEEEGKEEETNIGFDVQSYIFVPGGNWHIVQL